MHSYNTQLSKALNQSTCSHAPKGLHYSSLHDRVNMMIGIHNDGFELFFCDILNTLQSTIDPVILKYLQQRDTMKATKWLYDKKGSVKLKRKINGEEELSRWVDEKTKEELGIIKYKEYERSKSATQKEQQRQEDMVCLSCSKQGHYNKLNFMCPLNNKNQANAAKYGAHQLQQKEDNEGNLPPPMAIAGMTADVHCMPAAGSGGGGNY